MDFKKVGVLLRPNSPSLKKGFLKLKKTFSREKIKTLVEDESGKMIDIKGVEIKKMAKSVDLLISIGGDGTFLALSRKTFPYQKPILGINSGNLGFLTETSLEEMEQAIGKILKGEYSVKKRMVIKAKIITATGKTQFYALNELVIKAREMSKITHLDLYIDKKFVNSYRGDGLIVASPTGSTAYNLSASGPIVFPFAKNFIFTPICSHSFSQRPLVTPTSFNDISIKIPLIGKETVVISDGQKNFPMGKKSVLKIEKADAGIKVIHLESSDFFKTLRDKLSWGVLSKKRKG